MLCYWYKGVLLSIHKAPFTDNDTPLLIHCTDNGTLLYICNFVNFGFRWNDFEANISSSFRELRQTSEFFDVTLCCDNGTDLVQV